MRARHRGFTLVEVMIAVGIIGILASIAIPSFTRFQLRSKSAERSIVVTAIERAVDDYYDREMKYPVDAGRGSSSITLPYNPVLPPGTSKRPFQPARADWNSLSLLIDGGLYYSYYGAGAADAKSRTYYYTLWYGDLDGSGDWASCVAYHIRWWTGLQVSSETWYDAAQNVGATFGCL